MSPHKPSEICHEAGVNFVKAMNKILNNPEKKGEEKEYSHFIKTCDKHIENLDSKKNNVTERIRKKSKETVENKILCELMCCCQTHPARSYNLSSKNEYHQFCVKDILDMVNGRIDDKFKKHSCIPKTRFVPELSMNKITGETTHGAYNKNHPQKSNVKDLVRSDVTIVDMSFGEIIELEHIERFIEMKFPCEENDTDKTIEQLSDYRIFEKPMSVFLICTRTSKAKVALDKKIAQKLSDMDITVKCCPCNKEKNKKRMLLPDPAPATAPSSKKKSQKTTVPFSSGGLEVVADIALSVGLALLPLGAGALLARLAARAVAPLAYQALGVFSRWAGSLTMGSSATGTACAAAATGVAGVITPSLGGYPSE